MKLNHMICPTCGHDFYVDAAYGTCDACQTMFYAASSKTVTLAKQRSIRGDTAAPQDWRYTTTAPPLNDWRG